MTTTIKTQCPHCHACSKVQQTQLNKVNATVNCEQCHQSFLVNQHLIVTADTAPSPHAATDTATSTSNKAAAHNELIHDDLIHDDLIDDDLIHDELIHDDMDIGESETDLLEYDSLDSMDAWLTQASHRNHTSNQQPSAAQTSPDSSAQAALSSAAANDIHANVDDNADNAWLEALLKEESQNTHKTPDNTDLSQILQKMGVPFSDEEKSQNARVKEAQARFSPTPARRSVASLLWTLGCLVLALLLLAQYVIFNIDTLVKDPAHAERLHRICSVAVCSLPSADLTALSISHITHQKSRINTTGAFSDVSATLYNQSTKAQLYPSVKVSVYGKDTIIGEFIAAPADYLLSKQKQLAANSQQQLLFTIPVANTQIRDVQITPLY